MKLFSVQQIKECEAITLKQQQISSLTLMERAAQACLHWIQERFNVNEPFLVFCGMGNNGGDGLALTRLLLQEGYSAKAIVLKHAEQFSENTSENLKRLHQLDPEAVEIVDEGHFLSDLPENIVLIDALFGIGLNRGLKGWLAEFIIELNYLQNRKISIDTPSGLPIDNLPHFSSEQEEMPIFKADDTLSFQFYKRSFLHPEAEIFTGKVFVLDIQLSEQYIRDTHSQFQILEFSFLKGLYQKRDAFAHKGTFGMAHLIGGAYGKTGAIALASLAALRSGVGKVMIHAPACGYPGFQSFVPEAMFENCGSEVIEEIKLNEGDAFVGIGPGMGMAEKTVAAFKKFIEVCDAPLIIDADALNIIAAHQELLMKLPKHSVITPHPKEFSRLFGAAENSMEQMEMARHNAMKYNLIIVLKGHHTVIAIPDGSCFYNNTGNAGMATAGSGDVLTGILTGLLAQGYSPEHASLLGVFLHGVAGDFAREAGCEEALIARDLIDHLFKGFKLFSS